MSRNRIAEVVSSPPKLRRMALRSGAEENLPLTAALGARRSCGRWRRSPPEEASSCMDIFREQSRESSSQVVIVGRSSHCYFGVPARFFLTARVRNTQELWLNMTRS